MQAFVDVAEVDRGIALRKKDWKLVNKVPVRALSARICSVPLSRQMFTTDIEVTAEQVKLLTFCCNESVISMLHDEIKSHDAALDCEYLVLPPIAVIRLPDQVVKWLRADVVQNTVSTVRCCSHVLVRDCPLEEVFVELAAILTDKRQKLPPDEVATVERGETEKRGFSFRVTGGFKARDAFVVRHGSYIEIRPAMISGSSSAGLLGALSGE
jgi:hypothetical protein